MSLVEAVALGVIAFLVGILNGLAQNRMRDEMRKEVTRKK